MFYNALVQLVMDYGASVWGDSFFGHSNTMLRLQTRAARIIIIPLRSFYGSTQRT